VAPRLLQIHHHSPEITLRNARELHALLLVPIPLLSPPLSSLTTYCLFMSRPILLLMLVTCLAECITEMLHLITLLSRPTQEIQIDPLRPFLSSSKWLQLGLNRMLLLLLAWPDLHLLSMIRVWGLPFTPVL
jgi:hypothetical protein